MGNSRSTPETISNVSSYEHKRECHSQPPPYSPPKHEEKDAAHPSPNHSLSNSETRPMGEDYSHLNIQASDTPQWLWSNAQCRAWLYAVCITYLDYTEEAAHAEAARFKGMGVYLYSRNRHGWTTKMGQENGTSVYNLLISQASKPGAVPPGIAFPERKKKNDCVDL